jgi:dipeptidyl aminopeptidase/acylaminoacyl peptidase
VLHKKKLAGPVAVLLALAAAIAARPGWTEPLDVYGRLPSLEEVALSPDGSRLAFVRNLDNERLLGVLSLAEHKVQGKLMRMGSVKLRSISWADDDHLLITTSATSLPMGLIGREQEWYMLNVYDIAKQKFSSYPDPDKTRDFRIMNVLFGRVMVRRLGDHTVLFVPGIFVGNDELAPALFRVDLSSGNQKVIRQGSRVTQEWLVDGAGEVVAEEDYDERNQLWRMMERHDGGLHEIASGHDPIEIPELLGFGPDPDMLLMEMTEDGEPVWRQLSLKDGTFGPSMGARDSLEEPIEDRLTYRMIGGVHVDDSSHYIFFDHKTQRHWDAICRAFAGERVQFVSAAADFSKIVVRVDGSTHGLVYELVDMSTFRADPLGEVYDKLPPLLETKRITYTAADGLEIPAYLTLPRGKPPRNLPLIVLPHGGPAVRDTADFDWWTQALADQGYLVLQPNYRGSPLTQKHLVAGFGEWGRKMQTDLSDGVRYLAKEGLADPARVCIVGASYGGYAALAGVTLDPGIYRCAVSVAGISDLKRMLQWESADGAQNQHYWNRFMGVTGPADPLLERISPIKHLAAVDAPVLLIHGRDDTVVAFEQSEVMFDAMKHAQKQVEMVTLKNEDHWLSRGETRLQMLQSTVAFLRAHNPPD